MDSRAPFRYFGGKQRMVPLLLSLLPSHQSYIEVCAGAASLLFSKRPSPFEVINDIDAGLINCYAVLRDHYAEFQQKLLLTPYSRGEWRHCVDTWQDQTDPIERARRWYVMITQSFSQTQRAGWSYSTTADGHAPRRFHNTVLQLPDFAARLALVQIEQNDFATILTAYDNPDALFYIDPPYLPETRSKGGYTHEMTRDDHIRLLTALQQVKGKVMLSGYSSALYDEYLVGWQCHKTEVISAAAGRTTKGNGKGKNSQQHQTRIECVWLNPQAALPTLWETLQTVEMVHG